MFMQEQESSVDSLDVQVSCSNVSPVMQASPPPPPHTHTLPSLPNQLSAPGAETYLDII